MKLMNLFNRKSEPVELISQVNKPKENIEEEITSLSGIKLIQEGKTTTAELLN